MQLPTLTARKKKSKSTVIAPGFWQALGLPVPVTEYRFHPTRKWRFDACFPDKKIAIEWEGGAFCFGRHVRGTGFIADCEKYNAAVILGWRLLRYPPNKIDFGQIRELYNQ